MARSASVRIEGAAELSAVLNAIPAEMRRDILAVAVAKASQPMVRAAKGFAQASVDTGALRRSLGSVVRKYKKGATAVAVVGARRGYYRDGVKLAKKADRRGSAMPAKYAHLVEFGHVAANGKIVAGQPFMRPAFATSAPGVKAALIEGIGTGIERVRARMVKKGIHKA
jgi:hypothetical protein